jgi:N-acetylmuramoyl-L-alanine amidase
MLFSLLAAALTLAAPAPPNRPPRPPAFVVVLDPGHGGDQDGALSDRKSVV